VLVFLAAVFFAEPGNLDPVLDAYRLAHFYGQNPEVFLAMPVTDLRQHMANTIRLRAIQRAERARADEA
jgi:hypothetical protein